MKSDVTMINDCGKMIMDLGLRARCIHFRCKFIRNLIKWAYRTTINQSVTCQ